MGNLTLYSALTTKMVGACSGEIEVETLLGSCPDVAPDSQSVYGACACPPLGTFQGSDVGNKSCTADECVFIQGII